MENRDVRKELRGVTTHVNIADVENVFRVFSERMIKKFNKTMNPRYNIYINRINGRLDPKSMILKDENVCFYMFGNM